MEDEDSARYGAEEKADYGGGGGGGGGGGREAADAKRSLCSSGAERSPSKAPPEEKPDPEVVEEVGAPPADSGAAEEVKPDVDKPDVVLKPEVAGEEAQPEPGVEAKPAVGCGAKLNNPAVGAGHGGAKHDKPETKEDKSGSDGKGGKDKKEKGKGKEKDGKKEKPKEDKHGNGSGGEKEEEEEVKEEAGEASLQDVKLDQEKMTADPEAQQAQPSRTPAPEQWLGVRHLQTLMLFLCLVISYALRVNLSVAIVAMVDKENANPDFEEFDWDEDKKTVILSSFFWGYVVTQVPAGQLAERFGPKLLLVGSATVCSIFSILTPVMATWGDWKAVCASRVIQGLAQGFVFPSVHTMLSKWAPVEERGRLSTYSYAGAQFGTIVSLSLCGMIAESAAGWPTDFYLFGGLGLCWAFLWFLVGSNSPAEHPFISERERDYIQDSLRSGAANQEERKTPWRSFLTCVPLWALIIVHSGQNWGFWTLLTEMPNYLKNVLNFDLTSNGMLSALPYFVMWLLSFVFSWASDFINKKQFISLGASRKLFNTIAHWCPAVALIVLSYSDRERPYVAVALLTIAVGLNAGTYVGFQVNHIDLAPNYAGTMMGITNCIANIFSIIAPLAVGGILTDSTSASEWRTIFFIAAGIYFVGNFIFIVFGKAEVQPWNDPEYFKEKQKDKINEKTEKEPQSS